MYKKLIQILAITVIIVITVISVISCSPILGEKLKSDAIGFNNDVTKSFTQQSNPYDLLNLNDKNELKTFVLKPIAS